MQPSMKICIVFTCSLLIEIQCTPDANIHFSKFISQLHNTSASHRIVGGSDIPKGQYIPYQISMQYLTKNGEYKHFCGGSIIAPNRILTAAHCCSGLSPSLISIVAGMRNLKESTGQRSMVVSYEIHENYRELITSDIAILNIDPPLIFDGRRIDSIDVSGSEKLGGGQPVTLTGWGLRWPLPLPFLPAEWSDINLPSTLQIMNYTTITNRECKDIGMEQLTETEICAMGRIFKGACSGDSGGPLVMSTGEGLKQVGIVSYGLFVCGIFDVPDVYTRVSMFDKWIQQRIGAAKYNVL